MLRRALSVLEAAESRPAMILDAERSLFAVVLLKPARRLPDEARIAKSRVPPQVAAWRG